MKKQFTEDEAKRLFADRRVEIVKTWKALSTARQKRTGSQIIIIHPDRTFSVAEVSNRIERNADQ